MNTDFSTMRELIARAFARYLRVLPSGFQLSADNIVPSLQAKVITFRPARTLYKNRKPVCRSLDGIHALSINKNCAACLSRKTCTPQICLEIIHQGVPWRLILAYTSARNFLLFISTLKKKGITLEDSTIRIAVRDRGRWGEVCFSNALPEESC
ncbi:MAG: hypothetical protein RAO92_05825 [Candidatus Euphemobacter frigidus]|nr:hypothetical protein [Candidatus Euphemobacter frigidus]MDP8275903.1 hypothetical protein [Candidatus Euphemobacter frigidus]